VIELLEDPYTLLESGGMVATPVLWRLELAADNAKNAIP
jgi:hypothetical protein